MSKFQVPRGTRDILPEKTGEWQYVERKFRETCALYNYEEIRTPTFESTDLFKRSVGETTDIVGKEMYTFEDRKGRSLTLRPEGTASVMRAFVENKLFAQNELTKLFYMGAMFRYERAQKGRWREFFQFGVEVLGSESPSIDAEVIALGNQYLKEVGLTEFKAVINTLGDGKSRNAYREALKNYFKPHIDFLCADCKSRLEKNPLRILDCKVDKNSEIIKLAPKASLYLTEASKQYFLEVKEMLDLIGVEYIVDETLVRGLDYYNHTVFEFISTSDKMGVQSTIFGGGRYNGLVAQLGGPDIGGIGFALGAGRLLLALESEGVNLQANSNLDAFIVSTSEQTNKYALKVAQMLRLAGFAVDKDYLDKKFKGQMKLLDKYSSKCALILGDDELENNEITVKIREIDLQEKVKIDELVTFLNEKMKGKSD